MLNLVILKKNFCTNIPDFSTKEEGQTWQKQQLANADKYNKEEIWVHPDLQNTYQNNGKFEYPQKLHSHYNIHLLKIWLILLRS